MRGATVQHGFGRSLPAIAGCGLGVLAGALAMRAAVLTRLMLAGRRQAPWLPAEGEELTLEDVAFESADGVLLRGWFVRAHSAHGSPAPAVVFVHGWPWCRSGNRAGQTIIPDRSVDFWPAARALSGAGVHVLLFDLRNHGASGQALPVTFGLHEARDLVGAVAMLRSRAGVDGARIGLIGCSMGANTLLYGIPRCRPIRAAIAIQPVRLTTFAPNFARSMLGPIGPIAARMVDRLPRLLGGVALRSIDPVVVAPELTGTAMRYVQGSGDGWSTLADVEAIAAATPGAPPVVVAPSEERYGGYLYIEQQIDAIVAFFRQHL